MMISAANENAIWTYLIVATHPAFSYQSAIDIKTYEQNPNPNIHIIFIQSPKSNLVETPLELF